MTRHDLRSRLERDFTTAVEALDHHVSSTPDALALHYGETSTDVTYGELGRVTDTIAGNLAAIGLEPKGRVSVLSRNPLLSVQAMYGIWKAGGVYAPVNFLYTSHLLAYQLNDTSPDLLIVDAALLPAVEDVRSKLDRLPTIIVIGGTSDERRFEDLLAPAERPDHVVTWDSPSSLIYTSGTTGPSKGVVQAHRWINQYTWAVRQMLTPNDVVYNDLPLYHVGGAFFNVVRALWVGASASLWDRFSASQFWHRVNSTNATCAVLLDVMVPWLMSAAPTENDRRNTLNKAHMQPLPANHHEVAQRFGIDLMTSGFGQSEGGLPLFALLEECEPGEGTPDDLSHGYRPEEIAGCFRDQGFHVIDGSQPVGNGLMGKPLPFAEITVLNDRDEECPPGQVGQLAIRPSLPSLIVIEYLAKPAATAKAFANLWFHTGDAAMRGEDGCFYFVDRIGDRIRVRGENLSSFHVEELLTKHPAVQLAAVVAVPSTEGDEDEVAAFIEVAEGKDVTVEEINAHCLDVMPKFMRPTHVVFVDAIPRTPTNKIEKYKLRKQLVEGHQS